MCNCEYIYLKYVKQNTREETIEKGFIECDFLLNLEQFIATLKSKYNDKDFLNLIIRLLNNHYYKYFPKKYDYIKKIENNDIYIHYKTKDEDIKFEEFKTIEEFENYLHVNEEFIREHRNYKCDINIVMNQKDTIFLYKLKDNIINNLNNYNINDLVKEYIHNYSGLLEFILAKNIYTKIKDFNKFYYYIFQVIENKEIKNINDILNNFELLFCNKIQTKLFFQKYDSPIINVNKININIFEKVIDIINNFDSLVIPEQKDVSDKVKKDKVKKDESDKVKKDKVKKDKVKKDDSDKVKKDDSDKVKKDKVKKDESDIEKPKNKTKKQTIPKPLKKLVWNKWIGEEIGKSKCICCKLTDITQLSFHCGHIIAESNGGELKLDNLKPICQSCNSSIGSQNMNDYIKKYNL
jgi:hypothetical protein